MIRAVSTALRHGPTVLTVPLRGRAAAALAVFVRVGSRDEAARIGGISHFLEHLVFKGSRKRSLRRIKEDTEGKGGSLNAFTTEEFTCFFAKVPLRHFELAFDVLTDVVLRPVLSGESIDRERPVVIEEIKMVEDQPAQAAAEALDAMIWRGHSLGRPIAGSRESVNAIRREDLLEFHAAHYRAPFVVVSAAGDLDHRRVLRLTRRAFPARPAKPRPRTPPPPPCRGFRLIRRKTEQVHLALGFPGLPKNHPDEAALTLLNTILGGNTSSRLFHRIREEQGLAYEIGSGVSRLEDSGSFVIEAGVAVSKTGKALRSVAAECARLKRMMVGAGELNRAKEFCAGQLRTGLEGTLDTALWAGEEVLSTGRVRRLEEIEAAIRKTTRSELRGLAGRVFSDRRLSGVVLGPLRISDQAAFGRLLTLD